MGFYARKPAPKRALHVAINVPEGNSVVEGIGSVISPDGQRVVMPLADANGKSRLWVRNLWNDAAQPLEGTEAAIAPIWSRNSQFIAFFAANGKLEKIPATGGQQETICEVWTVYGASWVVRERSSIREAQRGCSRLMRQAVLPCRSHPNRESSIIVGRVFFPTGDIFWSPRRSVPLESP